MWAAPLSKVFLHLLYDKEILEETVILQWYSRKSTGGEDSGLEPQRKQLRQQVGMLVKMTFAGFTARLTSLSFDTILTGVILSSLLR